MLTMESEQVQVVYNKLVMQESYKLLALIMKVVNGDMAGKKIICRTPFHKDPVVHCILEILFSDHNVCVVKEPKKNSTWPWPTRKTVEEFRLHFISEPKTESI